ncbi:hypothetical protein D3C78_1430650 [compost metagenome]
MVAEQHVLVGRHEVQTVVVEHRRGGPGRVQLHHLGGDEQAVVAVGDQVDRHGGDHDPQGIDGFAAAQGDDAQGHRPQHRQGEPGNLTDQSIH